MPEQHRLLTVEQAGQRWEPRRAPTGEYGPCPVCFGKGERFTANSQMLVTCGKCGGSGQFRQGVACCDASRKCQGLPLYLEVHGARRRHLCLKHAKASAERYGVALPGGEGNG